MNEKAAVSFANVFDTQTLNSIVVAGELAAAMPGAVDRGPTHRQCTVAWLKPPWLRDLMRTVCDDINQHFFGFDLTGFMEAFQYTKYGEGDKYGWHMDKGPKTIGSRKLSFTLQLSDPSEYEGGNFEINAGNEILRMPKAYGQLIVFPSWMLHQVTPVTSGVRRSLVCWSCGPAFR